MPKFIKRVYRATMTFSKSVGRLNITAYAACISYFFILSLVPMTILLCSILPFTKISEGDLIAYFQGLLPDFFDNLISRLVSSVYDGGYAALTISILITLWSAGKGISALIQGINVVNGVEEKRNFIWKRTVCCIYTVFMLVAILVNLILVVFGRKIADYITTIWAGFADIQGFFIKPRYLYMFIILTLIFTLCYAYLPNKRLKFREQLPGAVFAALCWLGFSFFFSLYVNKFNPYNIYGNLAMFIVAMVWMYFCMLFLLYGACINRYLKPVTMKMVYPVKAYNERKVIQEKSEAQAEKEPETQSAEESETQTVEESETQTVEESETDSDNQVVVESEINPE